VADACSTAQPHLHAASLESLAMLADVMLVDEAIARMKNNEGPKDMKEPKGTP